MKMTSDRFSSKSVVVCIASLVVIFSTHNFVFSELIPFQSCTFTPTNSCEILNITIDPCPEAENNEPCNYYRGTNSSLTLFFKPKFNATRLQVQRYSSVVFVDLPDPTYKYEDREACLFTTPSCPIIAGETYKFHQVIQVLDVYPPGVYTAKWKIWNEENEECCFKTTAAVV